MECTGSTDSRQKQITCSCEFGSGIPDSKKDDKFFKRMSEHKYIDYVAWGLV